MAAAGTLRTLPEQAHGVDFWSNDYLGFSRLQSPAGANFTTAPGSRLISGNHPAIEALEARIAVHHGAEAALLFGSGYSANTGLLSCLAGRTDTLIYDEAIHASMRDGVRLSGAAARRCKHNSVSAAEELIGAARADGETFFLTESRFSMDGDTPPLAELSELCQRTGTHLIVDEAHSVGLDGKWGAGLVSQLGLAEHVFARVITYGKAPGYSGAAVIGSHDLRSYLINRCRPFIFTTAPRPEWIAGLDHVYNLLEDRQAAATAQLGDRVRYFHDRVYEAGLLPYCLPGSGPIQLFSVPGAHRVMRFEEGLRSAGYLVKGIRSPTVPAGRERLRLCLHTFNTLAEIDGLVGTMADIAKKLSA